jgi:hypothetical protein
MHEVEAQKAKIAILATIGFCREQRMKEIFYKSSSSRSVDRRATTARTNRRMSIRKSELHTVPSFTLLTYGALGVCCQAL